MPLLSALSQRRAHRAFRAEPVLPDVEETLWQAVRVAPSRGNSQPTRILVARDPGVRAALEASLSPHNREWACAAPLLACIAVLPSHDGTEKNSDGTEREMWGYDAGIATGNLMAQATALGVIAHPISRFDEVAARAAFGAPDNVRIMTVVAIGYPGPIDGLAADLQERETTPQERLPLSTLIAEDRWTAEQAVSARDLRGPGGRPE